MTRLAGKRAPYVHKRIIDGDDIDLTCSREIGVIDVTRHMGRRARGTYMSPQRTSVPLISPAILSCLTNVQPRQETRSLGRGLGESRCSTQLPTGVPRQREIAYRWAQGQVKGLDLHRPGWPGRNLRLWTGSSGNGESSQFAPHSSQRDISSTLGNRPSMTRLTRPGDGTTQHDREDGSTGPGNASRRDPPKVSPIHPISLSSVAGAVDLTPSWMAGWITALPEQKLKIDRDPQGCCDCHGCQRTSTY